VPGVGALAAAGLLGVPLGEMFVWGLVIGLPTALLTMFVFSILSRRTLRWGPGDEEASETGEVETTQGAGAPAPAIDRPSRDAHPHDGRTDPARTSQVKVLQGTGTKREIPLLIAVAPVIVTLILVAAGALLGAFGIEDPILLFLTDPIFAMFVGAASSYLLACAANPRSQVAKGVAESLVTCGPVLVLSGISGSLGMVIEASGLADILAGYFASSMLPALILVWIIAAVLHIALGSISISVITAAGILAPLADSLGVPVVLIALAAGSGALFLPHVSSNFFWMFKELLGLSTRGTFKTHTVAMSLASVISIVLILALSAVFSVAG
jgi:GntP family gluconate:H+ symporter